MFFFAAKPTLFPRFLDLARKKFLNASAISGPANLSTR